MRVESYTMRELEKLKAGLDFCFDDRDIASLKEMPGSVGEEVWIARTFNCDNGKNIFIGNHFFGSYNVTVLDAREVFIGDHVMIGPNHSRTSAHSKSKTTITLPWLREQWSLKTFQIIHL